MNHLRALGLIPYPDPFLPTYFKAKKKGLSLFAPQVIVFR